MTEDIDMTDKNEWGDRPDDLTTEIKADFHSDGFYGRYSKAMELVGNRHSKSALVSLVAYLLKKPTKGD